MERINAFSYECNRCGRCCHNQVITLSPYDLIRLSRAAGITTGEAMRRFTLRRGSLLRFLPAGCSALDGAACSLHPGRPLACRLYPLGMERTPGGVERFIRLEPAIGSTGVYGNDGTVEDFIRAQGAEEYLRANLRYADLLGIFRDRIRQLADFERIEPREFWRVAIREGLAETGCDPNSLIDALFDHDGLGRAAGREDRSIDEHIDAIRQRISIETDPAKLAAAAVLLAVSLGYSPSVVR